MQNSQAKSAIFDSIRRSLAESLPFDAVHEAHQVHRQKIAALIEEDSFVENVPLVAVNSDAKNIVESFRENLEAVGGKVLIVENTAAAAAEVQRIIESSAAKKIAATDAPMIGEIVNALDARTEIIINAAASELFECDLGITGAQFGISETGTLVIESDKEHNRLTSLIPPVHVCVLDASKIRRTLGEVLGALERDLSRAVTFITGPSRTSDIELTLAIGVHGPGELFVILIDEN